MVKIIEFDNSRPIYQQIIDELLRQMVRGKWPPGSQMPSVRELAEQYRVNPNTVQRVYQEMERNGWTYTKRGQGTFVVENTAQILGLRQELAAESVRRFITELAELGFSRQEVLAIITDELKRADVPKEAGS